MAVESALPSATLGLRGAFQQDFQRQFIEQLCGRGLVKHIETRRHVGLERKLVQQSRTESMDGLHLQATRGFQRVGEQAPRNGALRCIGCLAGDKPDVLVERGVVERSPFCQCVEHTGRHGGGGGLGEGDAEDLRRVFAAQQQIDHPLHQHMRLAGAGIGGHKYRVFGIGSRGLTGLGGVRNLAGYTPHSSSLSPPEAAHSLTRARWS